MNQTSPSPNDWPGASNPLQGLGAEPLEGSGFEKEQPDSLNEDKEESDVDDH